MRDLEACAETAAHWPAEAYAALFSGNPPRLTLAIQQEENGALAGFVVAKQVGPEWEIENIVVAEHCRRRGMASSLLHALLETAAQRGGQAVFLEVRASNAPARGVYEHWGFQETGRRRNYYVNPVEDAVLYKKVICSL